MKGYDLHQAINARSHRKGLANDFLRCYLCRYPITLPQSSAPANTYGTYYPGVYGKKHSQYPNK